MTLRLPLSFRGPVAAGLRALRDEPHPFALVGAWAGGGAVLGAAPARVVTGAGALAVLDDPPAPARGAAARFVGGGWFGFLGYGLAEAIEVLPPSPPRPAALPRAQLGWYAWVLRRDAEGAWWFEALQDTPAARARAADLEVRLAGVAPPRAWSLSAMALAGAGADGHRAAVAECVERIAAGELFQANVCLRLEGRFTGSAADAFAEAADALQPTYGAYVGLDGGALLSFSPELFLVRRGRAVRTAPIKGTAPRSATDPSASDAARAALVASEKDAAEHVMIVDLMRNDLGRVAVFGSVEAAPEPEVQPHPGLWHLVTRVGATLRPGVTDGELLRATFPPGSVTGAPKVQALKVISELEGTGREAYTGAIGMVSPHAGLELNVAIRTLEVRGEDAWFGAGGGIVADSDPEAELAEALGKARPVLAALGAAVPDPPRPAAAGAWLAHPRLRRPDPAAGLLETIAVRDGHAIDAPAHLTRLAASARSLYDRAVPPDLAARVTTAAAVAGPGAHRLRIVLPPSGAADVTVHAASLDPPAPLTLTPVLLTGGAGEHKWADRAAFPDPAALVCDADGAVLEVASANVWALLDGALVTPPADGRLLPGVTRARALALGAVAGVPLGEAPLTLADLARADALLVTSAIRRAAPAAFAGSSASRRARDLAAALRGALTPPPPPPAPPATPAPASPPRSRS